MTSIVPKSLADMIPRIAQLPVSPIRFTSFPIRDFHLDRAKAIMNDKPKPVPFSGMPGYSERGAPEDWDTAMGEVYGYRYWHLAVPPILAGYVGNVPGYDRAEPDYRQGILYGANNQPWRDGRQEAVCTSTRDIFSFTMARAPEVHQPPETRGRGCGCGFWAYFNRDLHVGSVMGSNFAGAIPYLYYSGAIFPVFGVVKGTGRVIIGEKGFRSQYAQITGLCIPPVAVEQLSWWIAYPEDENARWGHYNVFEHISPRKEKCSEAEKVTRIAQVEAILSAAYPSARLFTSQDLLTRYFPPDENYA